MDVTSAHAICEAADPVVAFCADPVLWGNLAGNPAVVSAVRAARERVSLFVKNHRP